MGQESQSEKDAREFTDSTRQLLESLAKEREHQEWLREKRKQRFEYLRGWITWLTAAWALKGILWESFIGFVKDHWR